MADNSPPDADSERAAQRTTRIDGAQSATGRMIGGRYELGEMIGEGGAARVYHSRDTVLDRVVAVKLLRDEYSTDQDFVARFHREARAVASLSHPNIVDIYDYGMHDGTYFIVMQWIKGTDLKSLLRESGRLDPARVVTLADGILLGLGAAHERGIIHRDVKPQNLLVRESDGLVKLTDFGVARALGATQHTAVGTTVGTAHYMAPEQAGGDPLSPATDLYAVGVVLFEALSGRLPYDGTTALQIGMQHLHAPIPDLSAAAPGIPPALARAVERALAKNPAERYPSAEAMRTALHEALHGHAPPLAAAATTVLSGAATPGARTQLLPPAAVGSAPASPGVPPRMARPPARNDPPGYLLPLLGLLIVGLLVAVFVLARSLLAPSDPTPTITAGDAPSPTIAGAIVPTEQALTPTPTRPAPTNTAIAPPANVAPPPPTVPVVVAPPTATSAPPTATAVPPTAVPPTPVPPTATPIPPTATPAPRPPTATPVPPTPAPPRGNGNRGGNNQLRVDDIKPEQLQGAYRRDDGRLYGLPEVALYGEGTQYSQGTVNFRASNIPDDAVTLVIVGLDDERAERCRFQVILNGTTIFDGANTFPNTPSNDNGVGGNPRFWNRMTIPVPNGALRDGANTLVLRNRTPGPNLGIPYILINDITFTTGDN